MVTVRHAADLLRHPSTPIPPHEQANKDGLIVHARQSAGQQTTLRAQVSGYSSVWLGQTASSNLQKSAGGAAALSVPSKELEEASYKN